MWKYCYELVAVDPLRFGLMVDPLLAVAASSLVDAKRHKFVVLTSPLSRLKQSSTEAPIELRRVTIDETIVHLSSCGSYFSTELSDDEPSLPPSAYRKPSTSMTSCVDLQNGYEYTMSENYFVRYVINIWVEVTFANASVQWAPMYCGEDWNVRRYSCTLCHQCRQYNTDCHRERPHRNCYDATSYSAPASIHRCADQSAPPMPDSWSNRSRPPHKCNCPARWVDSSDDACALPGTSSICRSTCRSVPCCSGKMRRHSHRLHTADRRRHKCLNTSASCPSVWFPPIRWSVGCSILPKRDLWNRRSCNWNLWWRLVIDFLFTSMAWHAVHIAILHIHSPANDVEFLSQRRDARSWPSVLHRWNRIPCIRSWIVALAFVMNGKKTAATCNRHTNLLVCISD